MGISGLLPALKPIHTHKELRDFAGKTIAVDAYGWLHKGVYSCAADIAMGKATTRYVNYSMERVRIMRHFKIEPYLVFDGGPLPAKKGTESERGKKREETRAKGMALTAQGKHTQAREFYTKCIDVTPQMAFQLIKALRAEGVAYVVAPYEADAQLAYLERQGLVDGILTEDSDLLVFGCKNVLFKFDATAYTVVSISRDDFGKVSMPQSDVSLVGWSDAQFRSMAILSGCDYLPSIPGIGLKTACTLLRKHKSAEQVVRMLNLEGKKKVPADYIKHFKLAEKCFQHQKVYCPVEGKLLPLTPVPADWTQEYEDYCGGDLDPEIAKKLAAGDIDPSTLLPMADINPAFNPGSISVSKASNHKGKGKAKQSTAQPVNKGGLFNFFGPNPIIPPEKPSSAPTKKAPSLTVKKPRVVSAGLASGKRTLGEVFDDDLARKKQRQQSPMKQTAQSKFFASRRHSLDTVAGPSRILDQEKENIVPEGDDVDVSDISAVAQARFDSEVDLDFDQEMVAEVEQEEGYISPMASPSRDVPDFSSPLQPHHFTPRRSQCNSQPFREEKQFFRGKGQATTEEGDFGDVFSSPTSANRRFRSCSPRFVSSPVNCREDTPPLVLSLRSQRRSVSVALGDILAEDPPTSVAKRLFMDHNPGHTPSKSPGGVAIDLRSTLGIGAPSEFIDLEDGGTSGSPTPPNSSPDTPVNVPASKDPLVVIDVDELDLFDLEEQLVREAEARREAVMKGWRQKFSHIGNSASKNLAAGPPAKSKQSDKGKGKGRASNSPATLKRSLTNVTPAGRFSLGRGGLAHALATSSVKKTKKSATKKATLNYFQPRRIEPAQRNPILVEDSDDDIVVGSSPSRMHHQISEVVVGSEARLARFRYS